MTDESEKRFHSIMDKLFHAPKSPPNPSSSSSSDIQTSRGKKRANPSLALALVEPRLNSDGAVASSVLSTSAQAPMCRPWDRGDLMRSLAKFKSMTWFAKPKAQKLISLCGWEPRLLPYVVDTGQASTQSLVKANVSSSLNVVANEKKNIGIDVQSTRIDELPEANDIYNTSDPNSVVLDCRLRGASVGLWAFSMVPPPMERLVVGYT